MGDIDLSTSPKSTLIHCKLDDTVGITLSWPKIGTNNMAKNLKNCNYNHILSLMRILAKVATYSCHDYHSGTLGQGSRTTLDEV